MIRPTALIALLPEAASARATGEKRTALITNAVSKGLDPNVKTEAFGCGIARESARALESCLNKVGVRDPTGEDATESAKLS